MCDLASFLEKELVALSVDSFAALAQPDLRQWKRNMRNPHDLLFLNLRLIIIIIMAVKSVTQFAVTVSSSKNESNEA